MERTFILNLKGLNLGFFLNSINFKKIILLNTTQSMFNQKNQLATLICFILAIHSIHSGPTCKSGEVQFTNSQCDSPIYIEGCLIYKSRIECDVCSYNYAKVNGICQFQPNSVNKCCLEFDFNG